MPKRKSAPKPAAQAKKLRDRQTRTEVVNQELQAEPDAELEPPVVDDVRVQTPGSILRSDPVIPSDLATFITDTVTKAVDQAMDNQAAAISAPPIGNIPLINNPSLEDNFGIISLPNQVDYSNQMANMLPVMTGNQGGGEYAPMSNALPLDLRVPQSVKEKIWANKYVDFRTLINPDHWEQYSITMSSGVSGPKLCLQPKKDHKTLSMDFWHSAFTIYICLYM